MKEQDDLLWRHLKRVPAFRALLRAVESRFYQGLEAGTDPAGVSLPRPILDLGCGDGHFGQLTFADPPEVGVDPWREPLEEARDRRVYRLVLQAAGDRLPFGDGQFGTVVSNSVLEHIPELGRVLDEAARVLRPGGSLVMTVPSEYFGRFLSLSSLLRRVGLGGAAEAYEGWFNRISRHHHCDSPAVWYQRLVRAGFRVLRWQYYFSPQAHHRLEWGHLLGVPAWVSKLIFKRWIIAPWGSSLGWVERWLRPAYEEPPPERGAYLLFVAQRLGPEEQPGPMPAASPVDYAAAEPAAVAEPEPRPVSRPVLEPLPAPVGAPVAAAQAPAAASVVALPDGAPPAPTDLETSDLGNRVRSIVWLALAIILAVVGQVSWNWRERPLEPGDGFAWYGLALLALAIFIWQSGARRRQARTRATLTVATSLRWLRGQLARAMMVFWSLILSWYGWLQVRDLSESPGNPVTGLIYWFVGIGLVTLAFWPGGLEGLVRLERRLRRRRPGAAAAGAPALPAGSPKPGRFRLALSWQPSEALVVGLIVLAAFLLRFVQLDEIPYVLAGDEASMGREAVRVLSGRLENPFITGWFSHPTFFFFILSLPIKAFGQTVFGVRFLSPWIGALTVLATYLLARRAWGRQVALVASILLAGYHYHIHYSRLSLNNIWDPLFALLVVSLLWLGWETNDRRYYLVAGLGLGVSQYFYMGARMLLVMTGSLVAYWLFANRSRLWTHRRHLVVVLVVALVVGLPMLLYAAGHPDDYMARINQLGIFQSGWLEREVEITGRSEIHLLWEQFWKSALAFNYTVDPTFWYRPDIPLLRFWPALLFVFGLALALAGIRRTPNLMLLLWIGATVVFAGALLENPPSSQRYVIAAPAACMLVALALVWIIERLRRLLGGRRELWLGLALVLTLWMAWGDIDFYFGDYTVKGDYGGLNTEVAHRAADYLLDLGPGWRAYFFGPPRMGISPEGGFPSVPFLVPYLDGVDVMEPIADATDLEVQFPATFIFLPERATEMALVQRAYPGGVEKHFPGRFDRMLFVAYEIP